MSATAINLNMLFVDMLPTYSSVFNKVTDNQKLTKQEFIDLFTKTFDKFNPKTNLLLYAIRDSKFEKIYKANGAAMFE